MNWITARVSSQSPEIFNALDETNHLSTISERILEVYGIDPQPVGEKPLNSHGVEHTITNWVDKNTRTDLENNPLDLILHINIETKEVYWQPFIEFMLHEQSLKREGIVKYKYGYIDGTRHHIIPLIKSSKGFASQNNHPGYILWRITYTNQL